MLPLGLRVQEKLERLIDKHMRSINASKVSLSSISSQTLWAKSGRLRSDSEFFKLKDRKGTPLLLAPTHEEEITDLVASLIHSPKQLPIRLYQIGRKYRDEKRPRGGLLRGREFLMKDLYTFDATVEEAHRTYNETRQAYRNFLDELTVDYIEARADSGNMGGDLSHEYHYPSYAGEDQIITCSNCGLARNEEFVSKTTHQIQSLEAPPKSQSEPLQPPNAFFRKDYVSKDGRSLVRSFAPRRLSDPVESKSARQEVNSYALKAILDGVVVLDTGIENPLQHFKESRIQAEIEDESKEFSVYYVLDQQVSTEAVNEQMLADLETFPPDVEYFLIKSNEGAKEGINLRKLQEGDQCPECESGTVKVERAIEIGHTFHLGTRYSAKLGLVVQEDANKGVKTPVEMGCHGIGVSRIIAAVASCLADDYGLNWPKVIAPFEVVILSHKNQASDVAHELYDSLTMSKAGPVDAIIDDRTVTLPFKMKDADMVGYPILVILGKGLSENKVEVQCRRLKFRENVDLSILVDVIQGLLKKL